MHTRSHTHIHTPFITDRLVFKNLHSPIILADIHNTIIFVMKIVISIFRIVRACMFSFLLFLVFYIFFLLFTDFLQMCHSRNLYFGLQITKNQPLDPFCQCLTKIFSELQTQNSSPATWKCTKWSKIWFYLKKNCVQPLASI